METNHNKIIYKEKVYQAVNPPSSTCNGCVLEGESLKTDGEVCVNIKCCSFERSNQTDIILKPHYSSVNGEWKHTEASVVNS